MRKLVSTNVGLDYHAEPCVIKAPNGDWLLFHYSGTGHIGNAGRICMARSADAGETWSTSVVVADHVSGFDTRNHAVGVHEGVISLFFRTRDAVSGVHKDVWLSRSSDNGLTWSAPQNMSSLFAYADPTYVCPFGNAVVTSKGLMQLFYMYRAASNTWRGVALFTTDGINWGGLVPVYGLHSTTTNPVEPTPVVIDEDRIVVLVRDNKDGSENRYYAVKSENGGATWGPLIGPVNWTIKVIGEPAPIFGVRSDENVHLSWGSRNEQGGGRGFLYRQVVDAELFFSWPFAGWSDCVDGRSIKYVSNVTGTNAAGWSEWAYPSITLIDGKLVTAWYDSSDGNNITNTDVWLMIE